MFVWSFDNERFCDPCLTREEVIAIAIANASPGRTIYTGKCRPRLASDFVPDAETIIDSLKNSAYDAVEEACEDWLNSVSQDQMNELSMTIQQVIDEWANKHNFQPEFYSVQEVEEFVIPIGWIGVDLDGTLAEYTGWKGPEHIGEPVPSMLKRVKVWMGNGRDVRIFTARASAPEQVPPIENWLEKNGIGGLCITNVKDFGMIELWDDRSVQVITNTGLRADGKE